MNNEKQNSEDRKDRNSSHSESAEGELYIGAYAKLILGP